MAATVTTNKQYTWNWKDLTKSLLLAVIAAVLNALYDQINQGELTFDWHFIGRTAATTAISYLMKNFFAPSEIVIKNPSSETITAVKTGEAEIAIVSTGTTKYEY